MAETSPQEQQDTAAAQKDAWLEAARSMREAALAQDGVAALRSSARFETRGRGEPVAGVSLNRQAGDGASARVGVVLDDAVLDERLSLLALARTMRSRLQRAWKQAGRGEQDLSRVDLHLLDIAAPPAAEEPHSEPRNAAEETSEAA